MPASVVSSKLVSLLSEWNARRADGRPCAAADVCPDDPALQQQLSEHIAAIERVEGQREAFAILGSAEETPRAAGVSTAAATGLPSPPGLHIQDELGRGGMGVVFRAVQARLNRTVALKMILLDRTPDRAEVTRFLAEAEAMAAVRHPNVAQVFDCGEHDGRPYLAMELLTGGTLKERMPQQGMPTKAAAELVEKLARGVHAAHEVGIVHRDLKPGNVLFDADDSPKVTDFGLAKRSESDQTQTNAVVGTPAYMSPEQARGEGKFAGPPADVWGLGVILYECLTGRRPFAGDTPLEVMDRIANATPERPGKLASVPRDLERVCLKCLAKEPADRYRTAATLADDLEAFRDGRPVSARPVPAVVRVWKWVKRNPVKAVTAVALLLVTVASLIFAKLALDSREAEASARLDETRAKDGARDAERRTGVALGRAEQGEKDARTQQRLAELREAHTECLGGTMALRAGEFDRAHLLFRSARTRLGELSADPFLARVGASAVQLQSPLPLLKIAVPEGGLRAMAVSADGRSVVVSHTRSSFAHYDLPTGRLVRTFEGGHKEVVTSLALSADGKRVVSGGFDGSVCVWDVNTARKVSSFGPLRGPVTAVAASADGGVIAAGTGYLGEFRDGLLYREREGPFGKTKPIDAKLVAWTADGKQTLDRTSAHRGTITSLVLSADGKRLLAGGHDERVTYWNVPEGERLQAFSPAGAPVESVTLAPDNRIGTAACTNGKMLVCDLESGASESLPLLTLSEKTGTVLDAVGSPDFSQAMFSTRDGMVRLYDTATRQLQRVFTGPGAGKRVNRTAFLPGGLVLLATDETVEVYPVGGATSLRRLPVRDPATKWSVSADGSRALSVHSDGVARLWAFAPDQLVGVQAAPKGSAAALSADGTLALTAGPDLRLWRTDTGELVGVLDDSGEVAAAAFSPDGRRVVAGRRDGVIRSWAVADRKLGWEEKLPAPAEDKKEPSIEIVLIGNRQVILPPDPNARPTAPMVSEVAFSPDGTRVLCAASGRVTLRDPATGDVVSELTQPAHGPFAFSPDSRWIAGSGSGDSGRIELVVWDAATGQREHVWPLVFATAPGVTAIGFSPDSDSLAALLRDGTLAVIGRTDGREMHSHRLPVKGIASAAFSPDLRKVVFNDDLGGGVYDLGHVEEVWEREDQLAGVRAALDAHPDDPKARAVLGRWYAFRGATDWAVALLKLGGEADPTADRDLAECLLRRDDFRSGDWAEVARLLGPNAPPRGTLRFDPLPASLQDVLPTRNADAVVSASTDGKELLLSGVTAEVFRLRVEQKKLTRVFGAHMTGGPGAVAGDGTALFGADRNRLLLLDLSEHPPRPVRELVARSGSETIGGSAVSADGKTVVAGYKDGRVLVWQGKGTPTVIPPPAAAAGEARRANPQLDRWMKRLESARESLPISVTGLAFDDTAGLLVVGYGFGEASGYPGYCAAFDVTSGEARGGFLLPTSATAAHLAVGGKQAAFGTADGTVYVGTLSDGKLDRPAVVGSHVGPVRCLAFDGDRLFSGGADQELVGWVPATGKKVLSLRHRAGVSSVVRTPDGGLISTATDGRVYLWSAR